MYHSNIHIYIYSALYIHIHPSALMTRMEKQGGTKLIKQVMKAYENHQLVFHNYDISSRVT